MTKQNKLDKSGLSIKIAEIYKAPKVIVEAAHIYTDEKFEDENGIKKGFEVSAGLGALCNKILGQAGFDVENWLFIDNYNPVADGKEVVLDEDAYKAFLKQKGFEPKKTFYEADLTEKAEDALQYLLNNNLASFNHHQKCYVLHKKAKREGRVKLKNEEGKYMCALLDAGLYLKKLEEADYVVTVLSEEYLSQQEGTKQILKKLGADVKKITTIYFKANGKSKRDSIDTKNVFLDPIKTIKKNMNGDNPVSEILKLMYHAHQVSKKLPISTSVDMEVMNYVS